MDFDEWRKNYETLTFEEQVKFHNELAEKYPEQAHYNAEQVRQVILKHPIEKLRVLEFGGWKADLANFIMWRMQHRILDWKCIEICPEARAKKRCLRSNFSYLVPVRFDWFADERKVPCDLIIATHFIEHLSNEHFEQLARYCSGAHTVYFEAPIPDDSWMDPGSAWAGYIGTHKLAYGWKDITRIMLEVGFHGFTRYRDAMAFHTI